MEVGCQIASAVRITVLAVEIQAQKYVRVDVKCFLFFTECKISQADACECGNEPSGSVKCGEFLD